MGLAEELIEEVAVDEICEAIAESAVESAIDYMYGEAANDGQLSLIESIEQDYWDQIEDISEGSFEYVESEHPEAVGLITDKANAICENAAFHCEAIRIAADVI